MTSTTKTLDDGATRAASSPRKTLRLWEVVAISVGFMGPVMAMSLNGIGVAGLVGSGVPFTFLVSFAGTMLVAYAFIRLTRYITHAGSVYALAGSTLGPRAGFFGGFALLGTYLFFAVCIAGACAVFFEAMMAELGITLPAWAWVLVPIVVSVFVLVLNLRESTVTARTLLGIGFVGIAAMVVLSVVIIARVASGTAPVSTGVDFSVLLPGEAPISAVMTAAVFGFLSWAGFESGTSLGEETRNPKRVVPKALLLAVVVAGAIYVLVMFAQTIGFGTDAEGVAAFAGASSTLTTLASIYIGQWFAVLIAIFAFLVAFASLLSSTAAAARLLFALARDGFGPRAFAATNPKTGVPVHATVSVIAFTVVLAVGFGLFGASSVDVYYWFATIATLCMVVAYGMTSVGVIKHTFSRGSKIPKWEVIIPVLGIGFLAYVYFIQISGQVAPYSYFPWIAGAWCVIGLIIVLVRPSLAARIGSRISTEDLD
ncbi:APC family permease [Microbacterium esteraromaticum]|uniref:APC family permease n=1 Tax=Microbacterium esteraromaticum TaxID=57043 RepID=UPI002368E7F9|nr:APC family permease [Microbacterium esteraromaticum]WDH78493.1 APC family permease [Microbacterium esteraromaticum]